MKVTKKKTIERKKANKDKTENELKLSIYQQKVKVDH